jgi:hypothetical protein
MCERAPMWLPYFVTYFKDKVEWEAVSKVSDRSSDNGDLL